MQKNCFKLTVTALSICLLAGCSGSSFHEDAAKRLENGSPPDLPGAIAEYKQACELDKSNNANLRYEMAQCCMKNNNFKAADDAMREGIGIDNRTAKYHVLLGQILVKRSANNDALEQFNLAAQCDPTSSEAPLNAGEAYELMGDNKSAADKYREAIKANGNSAEAHQALALVLSKLGDMANAEAENKIATKLKAQPPAKPQG